MKPRLPLPNRPPKVLISKLNKRMEKEYDEEIEEYLKNNPPKLKP